MGFPEHASAFIMDVAAAAGMGRQFLVYREIGIAAPRGFHFAVLGGQVIAMIVAAAAGMDIKPSGCTIDIGVGSPRLGDAELPDVKLPAKVAAAGEVYFKLIGVETVPDIDIAAAGGRQLVEHLAGYIGPQVFVVPVPVKAMVLDIDAQDAARHFGDDAIATLDIGGADRNILFAALVQIELAPGTDFDAVTPLNLSFFAL